MAQSLPPTPLPEAEQEIHPPPSPPVILAPPKGETNREPCPPSPDINYPDEETVPWPPISRNPANTGSKSDDRNPADNELNPLPQFDLDEEDPLWFNSNSSDEDGPPPSDNEDNPNITLESMKTNLQFIRMVEEATLESQLSPAELYAFWHPQ